ncbi:S9 family peptidase [Sphingomonas sp. BGYR3]|uniref:S9 family peptidase n=1 Tax=Sphingomonas sp. BGYR3 TaxID=2975483 RepID=UPI0021A74A67|nr:S9 family peptidase [Sphingomonas sp. BGYR3]MDG5489381.1 S9 family peptidase [Sphingomonas sp. BGYR3]
MRFRGLLSALVLIGTVAHGKAVQDKAVGDSPAADKPAGDRVAAGPAVSAADMGANAAILSPQLSPDGTHIAGIGKLSIGTRLLIAKVDTPTQGMRRIAVPEGLTVEWMRWAGNDRLLVSFSLISRWEGEDRRATRLAALDLKTGRSIFIGLKEQSFDGDDIMYVDKDGGYVILSTQATPYEYPSVFRFDLATGRAKLLLTPRGQVWNYVADSTGVVRVGIRHADTGWSLLYRSSEKEAFSVAVEQAKRGTASRPIDGFTILPGSDQGYVTTTDENGRFAVHRFDFAKSELGEKLYGADGYDISDYEVSGAGEIEAVWYADDRPRTLWVNEAMKQLQAKIDRALPGMTNTIVSRSQDDARILVFSGSDTDRGAYYLYDSAKRALSLLIDPFPPVDRARLSPMEPVSYAARDGLIIPAYLTLPKGREAKALPLIVMPHGGPFARDEWGFDAWVQFLAARGYVVLQPNFRGSTGYGRQFVAKGTGEWGRGMQDDVDDGVRWLIERGIVDPKRVCIMGGSYGGYAAMWAAVRNPDIYRCAISWAGISDVASMLRYDARKLAATRYFMDWRDRVRGDDDFKLAQISPIKAAERINIPLLIGHGAKDDNVPLYQSRRLHEALEKLGKPHDYVVYPEEGHSFSDPAVATDFLQRVEAFLRQHNPA